MDTVHGVAFGYMQDTIMWTLCQICQYTTFVAASCKADEIPHNLYFSARGCGNDKNNGAFFTRRAKIAADQRCDYQCNMELICGVAIDAPCQLREDREYVSIQETNAH